LLRHNTKGGIVTATIILNLNWGMPHAEFSLAYNSAYAYCN